MALAVAVVSVVMRLLRMEFESVGLAQFVAYEKAAIGTARSCVS